MLKQSLSQKLLQKLSPQQIQLMKLLQVPTVALEQRIKEELEANPALDEGKEEIDEFDNTEDEYKDDTDDFDVDDYINDDDYADYKSYTNNNSADDEDKHIPYASGKTFHERLTEQLSFKKLNKTEAKIAVHLIGSIDENGYLRRDLYSIADDLAFGQNIEVDVEEIERILKIIQTFDPVGVGARNLQECLLIQLDRKKTSLPIKTAQLILEKQMEAFTKKHYSKILDRLHLTEENLKDAIEEITKLNPKPGNSMQTQSKQNFHIIPDFTLTCEDGVLELSLNGRNAPNLRVSSQYSEMLKGYDKNKGSANKEQKKAIQFVKQKLDGARWFIDAIKQRQETLMTTMSAIINYQEAYFLEGDDTKLKPMILKDIADIVHLDISTVSRVANSKYIDTHFGTFLIKSFFSESLSTDSGEEVSTREVKAILEKIVSKEDKKKPVTDEKLASLLKEKGYNIARRTVAKYREQLDIPVARLRKEL
jgi:RNA polymerase sigma-54 factor